MRISPLKPFNAFWSAWPDSPRKQGASYCRRYWQRRGLDTDAVKIVRHVEGAIVGSWPATNDGGALLIAPIVYLKSEGWR